jgi:hypothetical protein
LDIGPILTVTDRRVMLVHASLKDLDRLLLSPPSLGPSSSRGEDPDLDIKVCWTKLT